MATPTHALRRDSELQLTMSDGSIIVGVAEGVAMYRFPTVGPGPGPSGDWVHPLGAPHNWTTYPDGGNSHDGGAVDIPAAGGTPLFAPTNGTVVWAGWEDGGGGNVVIVQPAGKPEGVVYAHLSKVSTSVGATVAAGEVVGEVGTTGSSTGNHLHLEVRQQANGFGSWYRAFDYFLERGVFLGDRVG